MRYRQLGDSGIEVSEIAFGSWLTTYDGSNVDAPRECIARAFDEGINFIDTSNIYGRGAAESFLGEMLAGRPRASYVLATKLFYPMTDVDRGLSRVQIEKQIDASLLRLKTDHVDLYQCHRYDVATPLEETMTALGAVVRAGKARAIGFSEWTPEQIAQALAIDGSVTFVSSQPQYSLLWRDPEAEVMPLSEANGISQIVWSPLAQGVLTGRFHAGTGAAGDVRRTEALEMASIYRRFMTDAVFDAVQALRPIAAEAGCTLPQFALAWVLRQSNVASAIIGASRPEQVSDNARASGLRIDPELFARAEVIVAGAVER